MAAMILPLLISNEKAAALSRRGDLYFVLRRATVQPPRKDRTNVRIREKQV